MPRSAVPCPQCGLLFRSDRLAYHMRNIHYPCGECDKAFLASHMEEHRFQCHGIDTEDRHVCSLCGKRCKGKRVLDRHEKTAHVQCDVCGKMMVGRGSKLHKWRCQQNSESNTSSAGDGSMDREEDSGGHDALSDKEPQNQSTATPIDSWLASIPMEPSGERDGMDTLNGLNTDKDVSQQAKTSQPSVPIFEATTIGTAIRVDEYRRLMANGGPHFPTDQYIICSIDEANELQKLGPVALPIVIPPASDANSRHCADLGEFFRFLIAREQPRKGLEGNDMVGEPMDAS